eukprot:CAMPEP_0171388614 /NCGR_PEP_ID=MMETSP0879-20121228/40598_1 /TAXON_ID=67004 /ORGANISM="Thalassiosira weissflogii, Strain CCMP1336" /LENGTH=541 /DNA_ID=CAMNT_0011900969 /DNA_START=136 /DNA_END=1761 /DNA_ORIENTATION=+
MDDNSFATISSIDSTQRKIDFSGLSDSLVRNLANDLDLDRFVSKTKRIHSEQERQNQIIANMPADEVRIVLTEFVKSHPEAERQVARLIIKYVGISKTVFSRRVSGGIDAAPPVVNVVRSNSSSTASSNENDKTKVEDLGPSSNEVKTSNKDHLYYSFPLQRQDDIMPNLSPIPWLSESSWASMSYDEKAMIMEHILYGTFRSENLLRSVHDRYYPVPHLFKSRVVSFGKGGVDRVVLGNGPRKILVLGGIHGNEFCGVEAIRLILQRHSLFTGDANVCAENLSCDTRWDRPIEDLFDDLTIEFLVGNPAALEKNTRFLKRNLNRLFDIHTLCDDERAENEGYRYELQRARIITESIRNADFVLDIHSCSSDVGSFALPSSMNLSEELAEKLPVKYVIESLAHMTLEGGTTLDCALLHDVPSVCVECGQHSHPDVVARAVAVISSFLSLQVLNEAGSFDADESKHSNKPIVMRCEFAERVSCGFEWLNQFPEFSFVPEYMPVFRDKDRGDVKCPIKGGAYIVMPSSSPVIGEEALFWASAK